jgi:hypothetical protein
MFPIRRSIARTSVAGALTGCLVLLGPPAPEYARIPLSLVDAPAHGAAAFAAPGLEVEPPNAPVLDVVPDVVPDAAPEGFPAFTTYPMVDPSPEEVRPPAERDVREVSGADRAVAGPSPSPSDAGSPPTTRGHLAEVRQSPPPAAAEPPPPTDTAGTSAPDVETPGEERDDGDGSTPAPPADPRRSEPEDPELLAPDRADEPDEPAPAEPSVEPAPAAGAGEEPVAPEEGSAERQHDGGADGTLWLGNAAGSPRIRAGEVGGPDGTDPMALVEGLASRPERPAPPDAEAWTEGAVLGLWWSLVEACWTSTPAEPEVCASAVDDLLAASGLALPDPAFWTLVDGVGRDAGYRLGRELLGEDAESGSPLELPAWAHDLREEP